MNRKVKLLSLALIAIVVVAATEAYMLTAQQNALAQPIRVACIGDSITRGNEYTIDLWSKLGSGYVVGDFGIGGATVDSHSGSGYINETAFQVALTFNPDVVIIMLGTNDANPELNETADAFIADYTALIEAFQGLDSKPQVWLVLPPPIYHNPGDLSEAILTQKIIPSIRQLAGQMDLPVIDVHTPLLGHEDYFIDGIHPKVAGAVVIAETIYAAVEPNLKQQAAAITLLT
ncbi:MAG: GDSL-type esterase/lipase family protein [Candidatus Bathyarchaeota archaeon]|nr:GDSL-type esterase/lipase family protein [Candidatus Bathyarchaeota archaeon]